jgi:hypothetical protein
MGDGCAGSVGACLLIEAVLGAGLSEVNGRFDDCQSEWYNACVIRRATGYR